MASFVLKSSAAMCALAWSLAVAQPYQPTTESLRRHKAPQWFEDAKFGIFIHWGPYAVPAFHEWYVEFISPKARFGFMYGGPPYTAGRDNLPEELFRAGIREEAYRYHLQNWGLSFAYDDFIPMFKSGEIRSRRLGSPVPGSRRPLCGLHRQAWRRVRHVAQQIHPGFPF